MVSSPSCYLLLLSPHNGYCYRYQSVLVNVRQSISSTVSQLVPQHSSTTQLLVCLLRALGVRTRLVLALEVRELLLYCYSGLRRSCITEAKAEVSGHVIWPRTCICDARDFGT